MVDFGYGSLSFLAHTFLNIGFKPTLCSSKNQTSTLALGCLSRNSFTFCGRFFLNSAWACSSPFLCFGLGLCHESSAFLNIPTLFVPRPSLSRFLLQSSALLSALSKFLHLWVSFVRLELVSLFAVDLIRVFSHRYVFLGLLVLFLRLCSPC